MKNRLVWASLLGIAFIILCLAQSTRASAEPASIVAASSILRSSALHVATDSTPGHRAAGIEAMFAAGGFGTPCNLTASNWANRDDDGDGVCNGVDNCPYDANPTQDPSVCAMQAITVPWKPVNPAYPHPTYSGAAITLEGIARYGGNQYMWDFGDGSAATPWMTISDPNNLGVQHVYTGNVGTAFTATLTIRNSANSSVTSSATYPVQIYQSSDLTVSTQMDVRTDMAADRALWYFHTSASRAQYSDGSPGYNQPYAAWDSLFSTCTIVDAFAVHGSLAANDHSQDPYVDDVRRALAYLFFNMQVINVGQTPYFNADTNGNGIGIGLPTGNFALEGDAMCMSALVDANSNTFVSLNGPANVFNRAYKDLASDMGDYLYYAQNPYGAARGAWGDGVQNQVDMAVNTPFVISALAAGQSVSGLVIPAAMRQQVPYFYAYTHWLNVDNNYGGWSYDSPGNYISDRFTAGGLIENTFIGNTTSASDFQQGLGFLYRHWADTGSSPTWVYQNDGNPDTMYSVTRALTLQQPVITRIPEYVPPSTTPSGNSFDWFYQPSGQSQIGYAQYLLNNQTQNGTWTDPTGIDSTSTATAFNTLVLELALSRRAPYTFTCPASATAQYGTPNAVSFQYGPDASAINLLWLVDGAQVESDAVPGSSYNRTLSMQYALTSVGSHTVQPQRNLTAYGGGPLCSIPFTVTKADQTISFPALPTATYGDPDLGLTNVVASSGLPIGFSASGQCTASGSTIHLTAPGSCSVTASQPGDSNYNAATSVTQTFKILAVPTITFPLAMKHGASAPFTVAATSNSTGAFTYSIVSGPATLSGSTLTLTGSAGTVSVQASEAADPNYAAATLTSTFPVTLGSVWLANGNASLSAFNLNAAPFSSTSGYTGGGLTTGGVPHGTAFDQAGNTWVANPSSGGIAKFTLDGAPVSPSAYTGGGISAPNGVAIDGVGQVWIANGNGTVSLLSNSGVALSPAAGFPTGGATATGAGIAIDLSGSVWFATGTNTLMELLGAAAPVLPLANAVAAGTTGTRP